MPAVFSSHWCSTERQNSQYSFSCTVVAIKSLNCHCELSLTSCRTWFLTTGCQVPNSKLLKYMSKNKFNSCPGQKLSFAVRPSEFEKNRQAEERLEEWSIPLRKRVSSSVQCLGEDGSVFLLMFCETSPPLGEQVEYFWR